MAIRRLKIALNALTGKFDLVNDVSNMVDGPASSTNQAIARFVGTTGKEVTNSAVTVSNVGLILTPDSMQVGRDASSALEVVTKQQLDASINGVDVKESVRAATLGPIALSGLITVDGVALNANDRVLVKNQIVQQDNGIYLVSAGLWSRTNDADQGPELDGALVTVREGSQANSGWYQTSDSVNIGVTPIVWTQFFGAGTYTADGLGLILSGSTFQLQLDGSTLSKSLSGLKVAVGGITNLEVANGAAIARSKIAAGNINRFVVNDGFTGSLAEVAVTPSRAVATDSNGLPVAATTTATELNFVSGVTSAIQTQLDAKQATITGAATTITTADLTIDRAVISNGSGKIAVSATTAAELGFVSGVTSAIQTQLNGKQATITGAATTITSADLTASRAVVSDGSGKVAVSPTTSAEIGFVSGVTSAIQTQLDAKQATITGAASTITTADLTASRLLLSDINGKVTNSTVTTTEAGYLAGVTSPIQTQLNALSQYAEGMRIVGVNGANPLTPGSLTTSDVTITWPAFAINTLTGYNTGSGVFTAPFTGMLRVTFSFLVDKVGINTDALYLKAFLNGSIVHNEPAVDCSSSRSKINYSHSFYVPSGFTMSFSLALTGGTGTYTPNCSSFSMQFDRL